MERSESITKLTMALVKFQGQMLKVGKDSINPHFKNKYASLSTIIEATQKPLADVGLAVVQMPSGENCLTTMLIHESGEFISETYKMTPQRNDPQGLGSAITYQRRYALGAVLNLNIDEDDDGNQASQKPANYGSKTQPKPEISMADAMKNLKEVTTVEELSTLWRKIPMEAREQIKAEFSLKRQELEGGLS